MISLDVAKAAIGAYANALGVRVFEPGDARVAFGLSLAKGITALVPGGASVLGDMLSVFDKATETVSVTLPAPGGTVIILSKNAMAGGRAYYRTGLHELVHAGQISRVGGVQSAVDWLGSGELRAEREAEACAVSLWADFLVSGEVPSPDDASVIKSSFYHLDPPDKAFARGVVTSVLGSIESGGVPSFALAATSLAWLKKNAPEAIQVADYR